MAVLQDPPSSFTYYRGYPGRLRRDRRADLFVSLGCSGSLTLAAVVGIVLDVIFLKFFEFQWTLIASLVGLIGFACFTVRLFFEMRGKIEDAHVVPYFRQPLGGIDTFTRGYAVAKSCQELDEIAVVSGITPLSAFGFNDDLNREELVWHAPERGLETIRVLLSRLRASSPGRPDEEQLIEELNAMAEALNKAAELAVPFCLFLRVVTGTCAQEWEVRQGSCC